MLVDGRITRYDRVILTEKLMNDISVLTACKSHFQILTEEGTKTRGPIYLDDWLVKRR